MSDEKKPGAKSGEHPAVRAYQKTLAANEQLSKQLQATTQVTTRINELQQKAAEIQETTLPTELDEALNKLCELYLTNAEGPDEIAAIIDVRDRLAKTTIPGPTPGPEDFEPPTPRSPHLPDEQRTLPSPPPEPDAAPDAPTSGGRILVIDNDPDILNTLKDVLQDEGYRVCAASGGKEGFKRLFQMVPSLDLILLDLMMPGMSGHDWLEIFDETPYSYIPVVIISAHIMDRDLHTDEKKDHFVFIGEKPREALKKPFYLEGFVETVKRKVEEGRRRRPPPA